MTPAQEAELQAAVEALSRNRCDEDAWRVVVTTTWPIAISTASRILRGALDLAEDATSEAFGRIARYADFRVLRLINPSDFVSYLKQVIRRCAYDLLREISRRSNEVLLDPEILSNKYVENASTPETIFMGHELREEIAKALSSEEQKLLDFVLSGLTTEQISKHLGIPYGTTTVRLHRMRAKIGKLMKTKALI
jgi:RNA polymerase sigma factor (sigma-70 family)